MTNTTSPGPAKTDQPAQPFQFEFIDIESAFDNKPPELDFVLPGLVSGTVGMLASSSGVGKTNLATIFGVSIAASLPVAGGMWDTPKSGKVTILAAEESEDILNHRLYSIKNWLRANYPDEYDSIKDKLKEAFFITSIDQQLPHIINSKGEVNDFWIEAISRAAKGQRLLILDTFRMFFGGDENSSAHVSLFIQKLKTIASKNRCAILFTHHVNKAAMLNGTSLTAEAASGAGAFTTNIRWQANLAGMSPDQAKAFGFNDDDRGHYVCIAIPKANYIPPQKQKWMQRKEGGVLETVEIGKRTSAPSCLSEKVDSVSEQLPTSLDDLV